MREPVFWGRFPTKDCVRKGPVSRERPGTNACVLPWCLVILQLHARSGACYGSRQRGNADSAVRCRLVCFPDQRDRSLVRQFFIPVCRGVCEQCVMGNFKVCDLAPGAGSRYSPHSRPERTILSSPSFGSSSRAGRSLAQRRPASVPRRLRPTFRTRWTHRHSQQKPLFRPSAAFIPAIASQRLLRATATTRREP